MNIQKLKRLSWYVRYPGGLNFRINGYGLAIGIGTFALIRPARWEA